MVKQERGVLDVITAASVGIADVLGHIASFALVILTTVLTLGVVLRWGRIDGSWTYDVALFALMWVAFVGAGYCALQEFHVTAGISLENFVGRGHKIILTIRYFILLVFLAIFIFSAWSKFIETLLTHQTTVDSWRWQLWIAQISAPIGIGGWLIADLGKFIETITHSNSSDNKGSEENFSI